MRYFIYQITNLKNNRFYIGQHRCDGEFLDSNYYGSGTAIVRAVKKHGIQNFKREVLVECTSEAALNFMESVYVGMELVNDKKCYNLKTGGMGGNHSEESKAKMVLLKKERIWAKLILKKLKRKCLLQAKAELVLKKLKQNCLLQAKARLFLKKLKQKLVLHQKGRTFSEEHKAKISAARKAYHAKKRGE
jgi:group I intron endonuclease